MTGENTRLTRLRVKHPPNLGGGVPFGLDRNMCCKMQLCAVAYCIYCNVLLFADLLDKRAVVANAVRKP